MKKLLIVSISIIVFIALVFFSTHAIATTILYEAFYIGGTNGNTWEYSYTVSDHVFNIGDSFEILYEYGSYENIADDSHGDNWTITPHEPINIMGFTIDGRYNAMAEDGALLDDPFAVRFDWLGAGDPEPQSFNVLAAGGWMPIETGITESSAAPIPEPSTILLLGFGLLGLITIKRKA